MTKDEERNLLASVLEAMDVCLTFTASYTYKVLLFITYSCCVAIQRGSRRHLLLTATVGNYGFLQYIVILLKVRRCIA